MKWFEPFPLDVRTGATFVHDWFAFFIWIAVIGHIWFAFADGEALRAMWRGTGQRPLGPHANGPAGTRRGSEHAEHVETTRGGDGPTD